MAGNTDTQTTAKGVMQKSKRTFWPTQYIIMLKNHVKSTSLLYATGYKQI